MPFPDQHLVVQLEGLNLFYSVRFKRPVYSDENIAVFRLRWTLDLFDLEENDIIVIYFRNEDKLIFFNNDDSEDIAIGRIKKNGKLSIYKGATHSLKKEFKKLLKKYPQAESCLAMLKL